jgi:hypothetical protein
MQDHQEDHMKQQSWQAGRETQGMRVMQTSRGAGMEAEGWRPLLRASSIPASQRAVLFQWGAF